MSDQQPAWEVIAKQADYDVLDRIPVPGGWIYRNYVEAERVEAIALVFVPEPKP